MFNHPFFHLLVNGFCVTSFRRPLTLEELKWRQLYNVELHSKDLILVHTVQLKPMIKAHLSGRMVSSDISDVAFTSVYSEKNLSEEVDNEESYYYYYYYYYE